MKINLKKQMQNKYWWLSVSSVVVMLLQLFGLELPKNYQEVINAFLTLGVALGILNNNSTEGFGD